jgi:murein DD-endopeptidase MepM/ murein hydrolase activator NlpD
MKTNLRLFLFLWSIIGVVLVTSAQEELVADTAGKVLSVPDEYEVGGADEEDEYSMPLFSEKSRDLELWNVNDSIARIPGYDAYCHWDTRNLFHRKEDLGLCGDTLAFRLCHEPCDFVFPAAGHMTSPFGPRWGRMHYGLDLDLETGDAVYAAFEGMVRISQYHSSYGNVIVVRHANGLETLYAHLSARQVLPGDYVQAGDLIGLGGNTGRSYGAHLHFEVRYLGSPVNPAEILDERSQTLRSDVFLLTPGLVESQKQVVSTAATRTPKKYHTVRRGETLSAIARKRGTSVTALCRMNKIRSGSIIRPGQKLRYR